MRMSRLEKCKVRNTDDTDSRAKNDLWSAWIYPKMFAVFLHCIAVLNYVRATHGLPADRAPVHRGCPCRDPLWCKMIPRQNGIKGIEAGAVLVTCARVRQSLNVLPQTQKQGKSKYINKI